MKKIIMALLMVCTLSSCDAFSYDTMLCNYVIRDVSYEIEYNGKELKNFSVIEVKNLTSFSKEDFDFKYKEIKKEMSKRDKTKGITIKMSDDTQLLTLTTIVDYEVYDYKKDSLELFDIALKKEDFKDIYSLREALGKNNFQCDEVAVIK